MINPYIPGQRIKQQFTQYSPYQEAMWEAMADTFYAVLGGYAHTRQPTPGKSLDLAGFPAWREKAITAWEHESYRDGGTRGPKENDMPENLWLYWYERMVAAKSLCQNIYYDE